MVSLWKLDGPPQAMPSRRQGHSQQSGGPKVPVVTIKWPENQRAGASLLVNDEKREIPPTGPIKIPLPPAKEQYHFRLVGPGFQPKNFIRASETDDEDYAVDPWEAEVQGIDLGAGLRSRKENGRRSIKRMFCSSSTPRMPRGAVSLPAASRKRCPPKEFRDRADKDYICVYIDNPEKGKAQGG